MHRLQDIKTLLHSHTLDDNLRGVAMFDSFVDEWIGSIPLKCAPCEYLSKPSPAGCIRGSGFDKYCKHNEIKTEEKTTNENMPTLQ